MSTHRTILAAILLAASLPAAGQGYMCYTPGTEAIVFKRTPCAPGTAAQPSPDYPRSGFSPEVVARCEAEAAARGMLAGGTEAEKREKKDKYDALQVGMSADCVRQIVGVPSQINASNYGRGASEQWVYYTGKFLRSHYVYIRDGRVDALQISRKP